MNWRNVKLIFLREVRDQLRDRRTLFMVAILPLILYPVMGLGTLQMATMVSEKTRTVLVMNAADLPGPPLVEKGRFPGKYFDNPVHAERLRVITDDPAENSEPLTAEEARFLEQVRTRLPDLQAIGAKSVELRKAEDEKRTADAVRASLELDRLRASLADWFERAPVQVIVLIPAGLKSDVESINQALVAGDRSRDLTAPPHPFVLENSTDQGSAIAFNRVREAVMNWEHEILDARLHGASLPKSILKPIDPVPVDLARKEKVAVSQWGRICPALLVILAVTGAFYPAVDLGAGEKERGTMETLLISPATRQEIVTGKFLTVMVFSVSTALLNLTSIGLTGKYMAEFQGPATGAMGDMSMPAIAIVWIVLLAFPLAALFSALSLAFAMFARSTKEGQYYLTPLLLVTLGLMMFSMYPGVELEPFSSVMPVVGPALLLKTLLLGTVTTAPLPALALAVVVSSICYSVLALWWAIEQFQREDVLFREAERFDVGLWLRHLLREKEAIPSFAEAAFCFVTILLLQFASFKVMSDQFVSAPSEAKVLQVQMIFLLATVATPPLLMAVLLTRDPRRTLKLKSCHPGFIAAAVILPFALTPLSLELMSRLKWFFPQLPPGFERTMAAMSSENLPLWLPLLAFAVTPAVCEELAFRGFILSGLQRTQRYRLAAVMSSVAFGVVHLIPQQAFNAALLGLVLAALALRSGSLIPCIVFHFLFNGIQVVFARLKPDEFSAWGLDRIMTIRDKEPRMSWLLLTVCVAIATPILYWLVTGPVARGWRDVDSTPEPEPVAEGPVVKGLI